ncbi:MAG: peptidoglycan DD-metalloendopeptidase family protein [Patescibacteria group bacterium]
MKNLLSHIINHLYREAVLSANTPSRLVFIGGDGEKPADAKSADVADADEAALEAGEKEAEPETAEDAAKKEEERRNAADGRKVEEAGESMRTVIGAEMDIYVSNIAIDIKDKETSERLTAGTKAEFEKVSSTLKSDVDTWSEKYKIDLEDISYYNTGGVFKAFLKSDVRSKENFAKAIEGMALKQINDPQSDAEKMVVNIFDVAKIREKYGNAAVDELIAAYKKNYESVKSESKSAVERFKEAKGLENINASPEQKSMWEKYKSVRGNEEKLQSAFEKNKVSANDREKIKKFLSDADKAIKESISEEEADAIEGELYKGGFIGALKALIEKIMKLFEQLSGKLRSTLGIEEEEVADEETEENSEDAPEESGEALSQAPRSIFRSGDMILSSELGHREVSVGRDEHPGIDIAVPIGTDLVAPCDGTVVNTGSDSGHGNYVVLRLNDGTGRRILFAHMQDDFAVGKNKHVKAGDLLGKTGNSGASTGPHVHVEMLNKDGSHYENTMRFFDPHLEYRTHNYSGGDKETRLKEADDFAKAQRVSDNTRSKFGITGNEATTETAANPNLKAEVASALNDELKPFQGKTINLSGRVMKFNFPYASGGKVEKTTCSISDSEFEVGGKRYSIGLPFGATALQSLSLSGDVETGTTTITIGTFAEPKSKEVPTKQVISILNKLRDGQKTYSTGLGGNKITFTLVA